MSASTVVAAAKTAAEALTPKRVPEPLPWHNTSEDAIKREEPTPVKPPAEVCPKGLHFGIDYYRISDKCYSCQVSSKAPHAKCKGRYRTLNNNSYGYTQRQCYYAGLFGKDYGKFPACSGKCKCSKLCEARHAIGPVVKVEKEEKLAPYVPPETLDVSSCKHGRVFGADFSDAKGSTCFLECPRRRNTACQDANATLKAKALKAKASAKVADKKGAKFIKLSAQHGNNEVIFQVVEQSHRIDNFGLSSRYFYASDGYKLGSSGTPGFYAPGEIYFQGGADSADLRKIVVRKDEYARIAKAVEEYNEYFKDSINPGKPLPWPVPAKIPMEPVTVSAGWVPKVGDRVEGTCSHGAPYDITRKGWEGAIAKIIKPTSFSKDDITVVGSSGRYDVESRFFKKII